ncbi:MAG: hypothetical protein RL742_878 [Bacteroidota bacterium]|jgi:hypothetical protein
MHNHTVFTEKQRFNQWWIWAILILVNGGQIAAAAFQILSGRALGNKPMSNTEFLVVVGIALLLSLAVLAFQLETQIRTDGIYVRFFPFHRKFKCFAWDELRKAYVRKYAPIGEYGGWGYRIGWADKGGAYNVSGNQGLQLEFTSGKKLLVGTRKPAALAAALQQIGQYRD